MPDILPICLQDKLHGREPELREFPAIIDSMTQAVRQTSGHLCVMYRSILRQEKERD